MDNKYDPKYFDIDKWASIHRPSITSDGYIRIKIPSGHPNPNTGRWIHIHRLVMEKKLGRFLDPKEVVHHIDENKQNNVPENLELFPNSREHHNKRHGAIKYPKLWDRQWLGGEYTIKGRATQDIADESGCNRVNVRYAILKLGIPLRRYTVTAEVMKHVKEAARLGGRKPKQK